MSETKKTGLFCAVALLVLGIGTYAAWPTQTRDTAPIAGTTLFEEFKDPLAASNLKVVTFDEAKGELREFTVRKDDGELWTIQSKSDYPADALSQVTQAANSLIGLKVLDVQTTNPEDHDDLGVIEPDVRKLEVGDEGVGRLVTFRDKARGELASIIIGDSVKGEDDKRYARIPGQDPVYVVKFDPSVVTTNFQDWIEEDLLQLSSIEIDRVAVDDYEAALAGNGRFSLNRNYLYTVSQTDDGWDLVELAEYGENPLEEPTPIEVADDQTLDVAKLNEMKNALDDLKFVDVYRKPKGIGATLQADAELVKDDETVRSLVARGFYPVTIGDADTVELMSANGEMRVTTNDGVQYLLRFGNIASVNEDDAAVDDADDPDAAADREGVNRYLLVTTAVNEDNFPVPDVQPIPKSVEELKQQRAAADEASVQETAESEMAEDAGETDEEEEASESTAGDDEPMEIDLNAGEESDPDGVQPKATDLKIGDPAKVEAADEPDDIPATAEEAVESMKEDATEVSGSAAAEGSGSGQDEAGDDEPTEAAEAMEDDAPEPSLTEVEWQELLEAEQEKVTKANQRLMDKRRDDLEAAGRKVAQLNERFADWYYVIPESTYRKLRISRGDLFASEADADTADAAIPPANGPNFNIPGIGN